MKLLKLRLGILLFVFFLQTLIHAQLVADGQTNVLSGVVSNISQSVTVGTNGSFTLLVVTNGSILSNTTGGVTIGLNSSALSNRLIVTGSQWLGLSGMTVGSNGSGNELDILNGGIVSTGGGYIGYGSSAKSNLVLVSDSGSIWTNFSHINNLGYSGSFNTLVVSNGGQVFSGGLYTYVATISSSSGNSAIVTGPGSLWAIAPDGFFQLGYGGSSNDLLVTDSGKFTAGSLYIGNGAGPFSSYNQLTVSNSGVVAVGNLYLGGSFSSAVSNSATIDGGTLAVSNYAFLYDTLTLNSGLFAPSLLDCFSGSKLIFNGGTLQSGSTTYNGSVPFVVGNGKDAAVYTMLGGTHGFVALAVSSNAVLNGSGKIIANVSINNSGTIAPGTDSLGTIVFNGALTLKAGSTALMKLNASDGTSDAFTGMSNIVYGGTLQLTSISGSYAAGQSFPLFGATNYSGAFATLVPASPGLGLRWDTNELSVDGVLRVVSTTTPTPVVGGVASAGRNLLIGASGGIAYDPCYLLTSTNLNTPISDWSYITTNYFDSTGATTFTNAISTDQPQQYFRLQVN